LIFATTERGETYLSQLAAAFCCGAALFAVADFEWFQLLTLISPMLALHFAAEGDHWKDGDSILLDALQAYGRNLGAHNE
jgi:hypothetical protein